MSRNDITGDNIASKRNNDNYRNNYDLIFGKKPQTEVPVEPILPEIEGVLNYEADS